MITLGIIFSLGGALLLLLGKRHRGVQEDMRDIKRMKISELRPGSIAEISGTVQVDHPLTAPFSGKPCVWYAYEVERYEPFGGGGAWRRVWRDHSDNRFHLYDGSGTISINPQEANMDAPQIFERIVEPGEVFPKPELRKLVNHLTGYQSRVRERAFVTGSSAYAFGTIFSSGDRLYMMRGKRPLYISWKPEELVEQEVGRRSALFTLGGLVAFLGGLTLIFLVYYVL